MYCRHICFFGLTPPVRAGCGKAKSTTGSQLSNLTTLANRKLIFDQLLEVEGLLGALQVGVREGKRLLSSQALTEGSLPIYRLWQYWQCAPAQFGLRPRHQGPQRGHAD